MPEESVQVIYPVIELVDGQPITTSLNIAEVFGKSHYHVAMRFKIAYIEAFNRMEKALTIKPPEPPQLHDINSSESLIAEEIWQKVRGAGKTIKISDRVKLLHSACQMSRIDQTKQHTRESILIDFADLCSAFISERETSFESKTFQDFISECCHWAPEEHAQAAALYSRFIEWYHFNVGGLPPSGTWFGRTLSLEKVRKSKSNGVVIYYGIGLNERP